MLENVNKTLLQISQETEINPKDLPKHHHRKNYLLFLFFLLLIIIPAGIFFSKTTGSFPQVLVTTAPSPTPIQKDLDFLYSALPKPFESLTIDEIPNSQNIRGAAVYNGHLWVSGDGTLIEYDLQTHDMLRYSNPKKADCASNLVIISNYLYAACKQVKSYFPNHISTPQDYPNAIYKINIKTNVVEHVFDQSNGIPAFNNFFLVPDGDSIWVGTDHGLGRINTKTDEVKYYTTELGTEAGEKGRQFSIGNVFVDGKYVWVNVEANIYSKGSMSLFDKDMQTWQSFGPKALVNTTDRFDPYVQGFKKVDNGIEIVTASSTDFCVIKKYDYTTKQWTDIERQPLQSCLDKYTTQFPYLIYAQSKIDSNSLTQVVTNDGQTIDINGRDNLLLSPMYGDNRYILTSATIDLLHDGLDEPKILINLGKDIKTAAEAKGAGLFIEPESNLGIVVDSGCSPVGFCKTATIWLVDVTAKKILKTYTQKFPDALGYTVDKWSLQKQQNNLFINDATGKSIFKIDSTNYSFSLLQ